MNTAATIAILLAPLLMAGPSELPLQFQNPPAEYQPWVYWYFMEGNMTREGMTADLEAMKAAGIGGALFLEVDIGVPRGPIQFMSQEWQEHVRYAFAEAERLGLSMALGTGPGWAGSGGSWVTPDQAMHHLVAGETRITGPAEFDAVLPQPQPREPFFGRASLTPDMLEQWKHYYVDERVLAFPAPVTEARITDLDNKALYYRAPYSSMEGVKPLLPQDTPPVEADACIPAAAVIDLTEFMEKDGRLRWSAPEGEWRVLRFGRTLTGQNTRPAPASGFGFETSKFDRSAIEAHLAAFHEKLFEGLDALGKPSGGLQLLHFDSWEMGSQNWSAAFQQEFQTRRGYDLRPYLPVMAGFIVESAEISERFLWDVRRTAQELVLDHHIAPIREFGRKYGLGLSIEPYDMNPTSDVLLGGQADVPMCEFWTRGHGFRTDYSVFEAVSAAHTMGRTIVGAEAFTADSSERWQVYPGLMKAQGDWAFAAGVNRIVFHTYQHQPELDAYPGMTMHQYGIHWGRTQTWWKLSSAYHQYLSRCQYLLRQGVPVVDILYLTAEDAPHVFRAPASATLGDLPDRRGYGFDGCHPDTLMTRATVNNGRITFPEGQQYACLVLPELDEMTPALLRTLKALVSDGATVIGKAPRRSPSLVGYPECDAEVREQVRELWGDSPVAERQVGKGRILLRDRATAQSPPDKIGGSFEPMNMELYPEYDAVVSVLAETMPPDVESDNRLRWIHRRTEEADIYFVANRNADPFDGIAAFRVTERQPEWWDPISGTRRTLPEYATDEHVTRIPLRLDAHQSGFVVFSQPLPDPPLSGKNFHQPMPSASIAGPWQVSFSKEFDGPDPITLPELMDWSEHADPAVRHYSGEAVYAAVFDAPATRKAEGALFLSLGKVEVMAQISINGKDLGIVWCAPWRIPIPEGLLQPKNNELQITVANLWPNRLIGDSGNPEHERFTRTTWNPFTPDDPLLPSGLIGPVEILQETLE